MSDKSTIEREWAVSHVFDMPPSPVVMRNTEAKVRDEQKRCEARGNACIVVHRDNPEDEWSA